METNNEEKKEAAYEDLNYTVDSFANGIAFGQHKLPAGEDPRDYYALRIRDDAGVVRLRSRYAVAAENPLQELERHLMRLSQQGVLRRASIYLGVSTDPFFPFDGKFDASMKFLDLFMRYQPGHLMIQTRSPLVVIAMPVLKRLGVHAGVTMCIESPDEDIVARYTPGLPRVEERLRAARSLKNLGVPVTLQVAPLLPYGDWKRDAMAFAEKLHAASDHVYVRPLCNGTEQSERAMRGTLIARRLVEERKFFYLRPDAANPLIGALESICPEKLRLPKLKHLEARQLKVFAA